MSKELGPEWFISACPKEDGEIDPDDLRSDISNQLGKPLTMREEQIYEFLSTQQSFTSSETIYKEFLGEPHQKSHSNIIHGTVGLWIFRIKEKLGETSIINRYGFGYMTRNNYIKSEV